MRWEAIGADRRTGEDLSVEVEAETEVEAIKAAGAKGMFVAGIRNLPAKLDYRSRGSAVGTPILPPGAAPPILQSPAVLPGEKCIYWGLGLLVTDARLVVLGKTFALAGITSVEMHVIPPDRTALIAVGGVLGSVGAGLTLLSFQSNGIHTFEFGVFAVGVFMLGIGALLIWVAARMRSSYALKVVTAAGEIEILRAPDQDQLAPVLSGINQAIVARR